MRNQVTSIAIYVKVAAILGMLLGEGTLRAQDTQEEARRSLRGSSLSVPSPGPQNTGEGALDPARAENGRPDPFGGAGEGENTDVDDPFANNPNGGAGEGENTDVDDPFMNDPNGGAGEGENTDVDDPFANNPNGGAGEGENTDVDDPFANDPNGGAGVGR